MSINGNLSIRLSQASREHLHLQLPNVIFGERQLARQVTQCYVVVINQPNRADSSACKILGCRGAQSTCADNQHATLFQPRLPCQINLRQDQLTCVARQLVVAQRGHCAPVMRGWPDQSRRELMR